MRDSEVNKTSIIFTPQLNLAAVDSKWYSTVDSKMCISQLAGGNQVVTGLPTRGGKPGIQAE